MSTNTTEIQGVVSGIYINNIDKDNELNKRIAARNIPSSFLKPQFSLRPVSTKYDIMPILDRRAPTTENLKQTSSYNIAETFNPGTATAPWSGYTTHINDESKLRNQFFALQKSEQGVYIPPSNSDLYVHNIHCECNDTQPFPHLFNNANFHEFNPNTCNIGGDVFHNNTRVQLKNV
tara:strand:- start:68 stop:598 length:531 start_codon:yes stop_codon:yes gene_type:complete